MIDDTLFALTLVSALGCGLIAGAFFAFSSFVMKALGRLPPPQGIAAMQYRGDQSMVHDGAFRSGSGLYRSGRAVFSGMGRAGVHISADRQRALSRWHNPGDDRVQSRSQRYTCGSRPRWPRQCGPLAPLREGMDGLKPCANRRGAGGGDVVHRGALANSPGDPRLTIPHRVISTNTPGRSTSRSYGRRARGNRPA